MEIKEKIEIVEEMANNFVSLPADLKTNIAWYLLGKQEEMEKHKDKKVTHRDQ